MIYTNSFSSESLTFVWLLSCSLGKLGERPEEPGQGGGGGGGVQERSALPGEHGRHALQPVSVYDAASPPSCSKPKELWSLPSINSRSRRQKQERTGINRRRGIKWQTAKTWMKANAKIDLRSKCARRDARAWQREKNSCVCPRWLFVPSAVDLISRGLPGLWGNAEPASNPVSRGVKPSQRTRVPPPPRSHADIVFSLPHFSAPSQVTGCQEAGRATQSEGGNQTMVFLRSLNQRLYLNMMDGRVCSGYAPVSSVKGFCVFLFLSFHPKSPLVALMCCHVGQRLLYFYRF